MGIVNTVNSAISKTFGKAASTGNTVRENKQGYSSVAADTVVLSRSNIVNTAISSYDTVSFSRFVPKRIRAKKLETAEKVAKKLSAGSLLTVSEEDCLREDRIFAAIVGMRLLQEGTDEISKRWLGGFNPPTDAELETVYRRLTQRVSSPDDVVDPESIHKMRIELLESYKEYRQMQKNNIESRQDEVASVAA